MSAAGEGIVDALRVTLDRVNEIEREKVQLQQARALLLDQRDAFARLAETASRGVTDQMVKAGVKFLAENSDIIPSDMLMRELLTAALAAQERR